MTWFKLSDQFYDHPKVMQAGNAAVGLWVRCCTYSANKLLDGRIPAATAHLLGTNRDIDRLVATRLWIPVDGDYWVPDFLEYNPPAVKVLAERAATADRQALWRERRKRNGVTTAVSDTADNGSPVPVPGPVPVPASVTSAAAAAVALPNGAAAAAAIVEATDLFIAHKVARAEPNDPSAYRRTLAAEIPAEYAEAISEYVGDHPEPTRNDLARAVFGMSVIDIRRVDRP